MPVFGLRFEWQKEIICTKCVVYFARYTVYLSAMSTSSETEISENGIFFIDTILFKSDIDYIDRERYTISKKGAISLKSFWSSNGTV